MQPNNKKQIKLKMTIFTNGIIPLLIATLLLGCSGEYQTFENSHDSIRTGMSLRQVFESGLADYLIRMKNKNVPGATLPVKQPVSNACKRHVLDISYFNSSFSGAFWVRVFCGMNEPSAPQVIPERSFKNKEEFLQALDTTYASFARSMEFRVESPPKKMFGVYDHYTFTTDETGKVSAISPVKLAP
jgi:hypothetical protein